jgi:hypothetical protein
VIGVLIVLLYFPSPFSVQAKTHDCPKFRILKYTALQKHPSRVLRIRIRMFLYLLDPDPHALVRGTAPDPDSSIIKQKEQEKP